MSTIVRATPQQWANTLVAFLADYSPTAVAAAASELLAQIGQRRYVTLIRASLRQQVRKTQILVESTDQLSNDEKSRLITGLARQLVDHSIVFSLNPELLGGIRIHYDSILIDNSVRQRLGQLAGKLGKDSL